MLGTNIGDTQKVDRFSQVAAGTPAELKGSVVVGATVDKPPSGAWCCEKRIFCAILY